MDYWGKASQQNIIASKWHRLEFHSLDVAATLDKYLDGKPAIINLIASLTDLDIPEIRKRLLICAALHDIGKFANNFQSKVPELAAEFGHEINNNPAGHGQVGAAIWERLRDNFNLDGLYTWLHAAFSHHGTPVDCDGNIANFIGKEQRNDVAAYIENIIELFGEPSNDVIESDNHVEWLVAGLIIISDWIGSNTEYFEYDNASVSLEAYWEKALKNAEIAINNANIADINIAENLEITDLLGVDAIASPLQKWASNQTPKKSPQLYIIEDLTGAGKTEAAIILAHRLMKAGNAEGVYWALPSQASANSLYDRFGNYYKKLFEGDEPSLVLAHSARDINDNFQLSIKDISEYGNGDTEQDQSAESLCSRFIAEDRKKTFLAHFGIGTLDQALLGVLPVRHQALRLLGLSRKILVVDEAHSYDPYVNQGLIHLLKFQRILGGSAIILSATLTRKQKIDFARAYYGGYDFDPDNCGIENIAFPLITKTAYQTKPQEFAIESARGTKRDLKFERIATPEIAESKILEIAKNGNCVIYIRNSVKEAIETYERLSAQYGKTQLFHARFCLGDRNEIETRILRQFGKNSETQDRQGQIVISTQVTEQSLDLSFDYMFTDLAPIDLLIQRAGRLQRHKRDDVTAEPILYVVGNSSFDEINADWVSDVFPTGQYVYPQFAELWRTMNVLEDFGGINLKSGSPREYIESVFDIDGLIPPSLEKFSLKEEGKRQSEKGIAGLNFLEIKDFTPQKNSWAKDTKTPTRLGEEKIIAQLAIWENGVLRPFFQKVEKSWRYSQIQISAKRIDAEKIQGDNPQIKAAINEIHKDWKKKYDPPVIIPLVKDTNEEFYAAQIFDKSGKAQQLQYSKELGLRFL